MRRFDLYEKNDKNRIISNVRLNISIVSCNATDVICSSQETTYSKIYASYVTVIKKSIFLSGWMSVFYAKALLNQWIIIR